ncbi:hypothetical protein BLNAU_834 [Blattamonas nauphoetae]|uniref:Uncharacterized protein n=1 Tax=Blattamonas nauphoetae TaxID=2049346 RepID=A0ABQ9YKM2_9EUKA|nr:hypothetical protein BLNAU_834 [Blattamonas nauphoetae]
MEMTTKERKTYRTQDNERHSLIKRLLSVPLTHRHLTFRCGIPSSSHRRPPERDQRRGRQDGQLRRSPKSHMSVNTHPPLAANTPAEDLLSPEWESDNDNTDSIAFGDDTIFTPPHLRRRSRCGCCLIQPAPSMEPATSTTLSPESTTSSDCPIIKLVKPNSSLDASALKADISCGALSGIINSDYLRSILIVYPQAKPLIVALKVFLLHLQLKRNFHPKAVPPLVQFYVCNMSLPHDFPSSIQLTPASVSSTFNIQTSLDLPSPTIACSLIPTIACSLIPTIACSLIPTIACSLIPTLACSLLSRCDRHSMSTSLPIHLRSNSNFTNFKLFLQISYSSCGKSALKRNCEPDLNATQQCTSFRPFPSRGKPTNGLSFCAIVLVRQHHLEFAHYAPTSDHCNRKDNIIEHKE